MSKSRKRSRSADVTALVPSNRQRSWVPGSEERGQDSLWRAALNAWIIQQGSSKQLADALPREFFVRYSQAIWQAVSSQLSARGSIVSDLKRALQPNVFAQIESTVDIIQQSSVELLLPGLMTVNVWGYLGQSDVWEVRHINTHWARHTRYLPHPTQHLSIAKVMQAHGKYRREHPGQKDQTYHFLKAHYRVLKESTSWVVRGPMRGWTQSLKIAKQRDATKNKRKRLNIGRNVQSVHFVHDHGIGCARSLLHLLPNLTTLTMEDDGWSGFRFPHLGRKLKLSTLALRSRFMSIEFSMANLVCMTQLDTLRHLSFSSGIENKVEDVVRAMPSLLTIKVEGRVVYSAVEESL